MSWHQSLASTTMFKRHVKYWISGKDEQNDGVLFFFHGFGECVYPSRSKKYGPLASKSYSNMTVIQPVCPKFKFWNIQACLDFIDEMLVRYGLNRKQLYLGGASMGAFAVYNLISHRPHAFAAALVAGGTGTYIRGMGMHYKMLDLDSLRKTSTKIWSFHGRLDFLMSTDDTVNFLRSLSPADVKLTIFTFLGHMGTIKRVFRSKEYYAWLQLHRLEVNRRKS